MVIGRSVATGDFKKCEFASRRNYKLERMLFPVEVVLVHFFLDKFKNVEIVTRISSTGLELAFKSGYRSLFYLYFKTWKRSIRGAFSLEKGILYLHGSHMACLPSLMTATLAHGPTYICIVSARTSLTLISFYLFHCFNSRYYKFFLNAMFNFVVVKNIKQK